MVILNDGDKEIIIGTNACNAYGCTLLDNSEYMPKKKRFQKYTIFHIDGYSCGCGGAYYNLSYNGKKYTAENLTDFVIADHLTYTDDELIFKAKKKRKNEIITMTISLMFFAVVSTLYLLYGGTYLLYGGIK